jgi:Ca-activated chloride channel family protein
MLTFNSQVTQAVRLGPFAANREQLRSAVNNLFPGGETAVYDATDRGFRAIGDLRDDARINAVVVLTDGEDNQSHLADREVVDELTRQSRSEGLAVRVYTIAYGSEANQDVLANIANASGGKPFKGDPKQIEAVYRSISSFF